MDRPPLEVADLVRAAGDAFIERSRKWITWKHVKVLLAIARCRTAALGGHFDECTRCGHRAISYNLPQPSDLGSRPLAGSTSPGTAPDTCMHQCGNSSRSGPRPQTPRCRNRFLHRSAYLESEA